VAVDQATRDILQAFATAVRSARRARRWTQQQLAAKAGISQAHQARLERADVPELSFRLAGTVMRVLGGRLEAGFVGLAVTAAARDEAHARCVAFVARRLERAGFLVATEVDVGTDRWPGFADVLAFHPGSHVLYVIEVKTEIHDLGEIDRQLGVAERGAWAAAHHRGWRPRRVSGVLLVLATDENDRRLVQHRAIFDRQYRVRSRELEWLLGGDPGTEPERGARGLAMIDPRSRRRAWLRATWIDGRRTPAPYADRMAYLASR
jgi:transcriptional regulator with XRE-family HTH domain